MYYSYADYQGSLIALTDKDGAVVEKYAYDPWGARRNPTNWNETDNRLTWLIDRGYTGHEHIDKFNIINMNGRVYDPLTAQFLSPDPYVQAPGNWLNYNRYSYCYGNPFRYTDPSGEWIHLVIGAAIGGVVNWAVNGAEFSWKGLGYFGIGAVAGALGAGIGAGISSALPIAGQTAGGFAAGFWGTSAATTATSSFFAGAAIGGGAGFASGFTTGFGNDLIQGGKFGHALGQGGTQGLIGGASGALMGGIAGGIDAARDGRTFWRGGTIAKEQLAYDYSYDGIPLNKQKGKYGCVDNAIDNVSASNNNSVLGADVRDAMNGGSSYSNGIDDKQALKKYAEMTGKKLSGVTGIDKSLMNDLYHTIGTEDILSSYPSESMNDMVNLQGAYRQTITYPNGSLSSPKVMYYVLDNGRQIVRSASFFRGSLVSFFRLITN